MLGVRVPLGVPKMKEKCNLLLRALLGDWRLMEKWWKSPNKAFDRRRPEEVDIEEVYNYLLDAINK